jgi:hypothetical protein
VAITALIPSPAAKTPAPAAVQQKTEKIPEPYFPNGGEPWPENAFKNNPPRKTSPAFPEKVGTEHSGDVWGNGR